MGNGVVHMDAISNDNELTELAAIGPNDWALGPGSITWKVLRDPVVFMLGQIRNSMVLLLHPPFAASAEHDTFVVDPLLRFRRVGMYSYTVSYGTKQDAERLSRMVRNRHRQVVGTEPLTNQPYQSHSEYELALTAVIQAWSYLAIYEEINGPLPTSERDQFIEEQRIPAALLGIAPEHLPVTHAEALELLNQAEKRFAVGARGRDLLNPMDRSRYPEGTALGDLPTHQRLGAQFTYRMIADMVMLTLLDEEHLLLAISRRPKLGSKRLVRASLRAFSKFMLSDRGQQYWDTYLQKRASMVFRRP